MSILVALPRDHYQMDVFEGFRAGEGAAASNARAMAWLAQLAYDADDTDKLESVLAGWGLTLIKPIQGVVAAMANTRAFIAEREDAVFAAFEGTDPLVAANWISDFDILRADDHVAQGFEQALDAVWDEFSQRIIEVRRGRRLFLTGHSLGAALAGLAGFHLVSAPHDVRPDAIFAFGMPRVGDEEFAREFDRRDLTQATLRLVYGEDLVPTVPPSLAGFRHVGRYWPTARGARFDLQAGAAATSTDKPDFVAEHAGGLKGLLHLATTAFEGEGQPSSGPPPGTITRRTDVAGRIIDALPGKLRDHMPDCYCGALAPFDFMLGRT